MKCTTPVVRDETPAWCDRVFFVSVAMKKMVFKVHLRCAKCKTSILKAVAKLEGIDEITLDSEKGTVTVVGEVDPVCVVTRLRKTGRAVDLDSVGPHKVGDPAKPKPPKPPEPLPPCCDGCRVAHPPISLLLINDSPPPCTIL